jgi:hypothetical protein
MLVNPPTPTPTPTPTRAARIAPEEPPKASRRKGWLIAGAAIAAIVFAVAVWQFGAFDHALAPLMQGAPSTAAPQPSR